MGDDPKTAHGEGLQCDDIIQLKALYLELKEDIKNIDYQVREHGEELKDIKEFQGGTKVYVVEIKDQLNRLEERLFTFMGDLVKNLTRKEETVATAAVKKEEIIGAAANKKWEKNLSFIKDVLKFAIPAIIGYLLAIKGVKK